MQLNYLRRFRLPDPDTLNQSAHPSASSEGQHGHQTIQEEIEALSGWDMRTDSSSRNANEGIEDIETQILTRHAKSDERPEKCPLPSCQYHTKGFARKSDRNRHTLTHYKGNMVCGFCTGSDTLAEKSFARLDVFKRHLVSVHGVEHIPPNARRRASPERSSNTVDHAGTGNCSTCGNTFSSAQQFYNHLDDCVFSVIQDQSHDNLVATAITRVKSSNADKIANDKNNQSDRLGRSASFSPGLNVMVSASHLDDMRAQSSAPSSQSRQVLESGLEESLEDSQPLVEMSIQDSKLDSGYIGKDMTEDFSGEGASSITSAPYERPSHGNHLSAPHHSLVNERLQAANAARSLSHSAAPVERSPFKRGSPLAPIQGRWNESASRARMSHSQNPSQQGGDFDTTAIMARQASAMKSQESGDEVVPASNNLNTSFGSRLHLPHETPGSIDPLIPVSRNYELNSRSPPDLNRHQKQALAQQRAQLMALQQRQMMQDEKLSLEQKRNDVISTAWTQANLVVQPHLHLVAEPESPKQGFDFATDFPRTISPKHALLDYHDDGYSAYAQPPLRQSQPSIIAQRPSMLNRQSDETSSPYFPQLIISSGFNDIPEIAFGDHGHLRRNASFNQQFDDQEEEDDGQIDCICGFNEDDGNVVACDTCNKWQHIICYYPQSGDCLPDELQHWCVKCRPDSSFNGRANAQAAHIRQREARADRYGLQNSNKQQNRKIHRKKKTKNAAGAGLTNGWPRNMSRFDDSHPDDRYVPTEQRSNNPSPASIIPGVSHYASPYGEEEFKASDDMAATLKTSEVQSGRDTLEMLYEAAVLGRVDSSTITQRPSYEPHNHTSEAPAHASLDAPLWNSEGFYEDSPSPPTEPEVKRKDLSIEEPPKEWTFLAGTNGYRTPKHPVNPPLRRGKPLGPQEQRMRTTRACFRCRQRKIKCELGVNGCLWCERARKPCELSSEHSPDNQQAEDARQIPELGHTVSSLLPSSMKHKEQPPVPNLLSGADQETLQSFFHSNDPFSNGDQESLDRQRLLDAAVADQSELQSESRLEETTFAGSANAYDKQLLGRMTHM
jgi:hypothetical protein